jgi:hypothetical protein
MARSQQNQHHVRRVTLPSGKSVEVVYFEDHSSKYQRAANLEPTPAEGLHVCSQCDSDLVYPLEWDEASETLWEVTLRCPNCEWKDTGVYEQEVVERFDVTLDRGTQALADDLKRLTVANMEEEIDRFAASLDAGLILPEDF